MGRKNNSFPLKNALLLGGGALLAAALYRSAKDKSANTGNAPVSGGSSSLGGLASTGLNVAATSQASGVLSRGSKGALVKALQSHINSKIDSMNLDYTKLIVDSAFGAKTEAAMIAMYGVKSATLVQVVAWGTTPQMLAMKKVYTGGGSGSSILNNFLNPFGK